MGPLGFLVVIVLVMLVLFAILFLAIARGFVAIESAIKALPQRRKTKQPAGKVMPAKPWPAPPLKEKGTDTASPHAS